MRVAIFTDNDFDKVNGVTTTLKAVLRERPPDISRASTPLPMLGVDRDDYLALRSFGVAIPFYREMKMYLPRFAAFLERARRDGVDVVHSRRQVRSAWRRCTSPGSALPMIGQLSHAIWRIHRC